MRAYEILTEITRPSTTLYDNGHGEVIHIEDRGPKYRLMGAFRRYYGWTSKYDMDWDTEDEMMAWLNKKGFRVVGWESVEEDVIPFRGHDTRPNKQKYDDALELQTGNRSDLGDVPCPYCDDVWCNFDCDEAQAGGFEDDELFNFDKMDEGDVIDTKFTQKLGQKRGMYYNPELEPPVSRHSGESYVRFELEPLPSGKSAAMIGVLADGTREEIGFTNMKLADALTRAYNAGGYTNLDISRIPLGRSKE